MLRQIFAALSPLLLCTLSGCSSASAPEERFSSGELELQTPSDSTDRAPSDAVPTFTTTTLHYVDRSSRVRPILVYAPRRPGKYPLFIWVTGTNGVFDGPAEKRVLETMTAKGVVSVSVGYDDTFIDQFDCEALEKKAQAIFGTARTAALPVVVSSVPFADTSKGIAVGGFSQGSWLAHMGASISSDVRAAWLLSSGVEMDYGIAMPLGCNAASANRRIPIRAFSGEHDTVYAKPADPSIIATQLAAVTGIPRGPGTPAEGFDSAHDSGWRLVADAEVVDGLADHGYFFMNGNFLSATAGSLDATWNTSTVEWGRAANLTWLYGHLSP